MSWLRSRKQQGHVADRIHGCRIESLETRRLFTLDLFFTAGGVLNVSETSNGVNNSTTLEMSSDGTQISINEGSDPIADTASMEDNGWTLSNNNHADTGPIAGITLIEVDTYDGSDILDIRSTTVPVDVAPRGGNSELIDIGTDDTPNGCQGVTGAITYNGTRSQACSIDVDDRDDSGNVDPTLTSNQILDLSPGVISFGAPKNGTGSLSIDIEAGTGTSGFVVQQNPNNPTPIAYQVDSFGRGTVGVSSLNANSSLLVESQVNGTEDVRVGAAGLLSGIKGVLTVNGNAGTASVTFNDSADPSAQTFAVKSGSDADLEFDEDGNKVAILNHPLTALTLETGTASNTVNLALQNVSTAGFVATIDSNGTNDTVNLTSQSASSQVDIVGGAGVDNVNLNAEGILGKVNVSNPTGLDALTVDGSGTGLAQAITVDPTFVTGLGIGAYSFSNLKSLSVIGGSDFDNFTVFPGTSIPITVDGGPDTTASPDRLEIETGNLTGTVLTFQPGSTTAGAYTFTNAQPVNFTRIGVLDPTFGNITGTTYNAQSAVPLSGVTLVVDKNGNGVADAGEPTATSSASGTFTLTGLPTGTFNLLAIDPGFALAAPVSVTVSAGVLSNPIALPLIPIAVATGPDLTVTATAVAVSKTGAIKPKVVVKITNIGTAAAASSGLQIKLFASADQILDPADAPLLTTTTAALILNPKKSKSITLTGATAASLTKGSYYILASVDTANAVAETNESNNVAATKPILLAPPVVDLTGKFGALPKKTSKSKLLSVALTIQNLGTIAATGTIAVDFFASTDKNLGPADTTIGSQLPVIVKIAAGKSQPAKFKLAISSLPAGSYYLVAKINSTGSIAESDLTNNDVFSSTLIAVM